MSQHPITFKLHTKIHLTQIFHLVFYVIFRIDPDLYKISTFDSYLMITMLLIKVLKKILLGIQKETVHSSLLFAQSVPS